MSRRACDIRRRSAYDCSRKSVNSSNSLAAILLHQTSQIPTKQSTISLVASLQPGNILIYCIRRSSVKSAILREYLPANRELHLLTLIARTSDSPEGATLRATSLAVMLRLTDYDDARRCSDSPANLCISKDTMVSWYLSNLFHTTSASMTTNRSGSLGMSLNPRCASLISMS